MSEDLLKEIVEINSVFPNELGLGVFVERYLKDVGFVTYRQKVEENRFNILAERGKSSHSILFYGHLDTVPVYGKWNTDPFKLTRRGDRMYGLGSCDMKGGLSVILDSVKHKTDKKIKLLLCVDEENISKGAWRAFKEKKGWFKGVSLAVSGEPGDSHKYTGGANVVTLGRRGRVVFSIDVEGRASHGANPGRGINAIDESSKIVNSLKFLPLKIHKKMGSESVFVSKMQSASTSLSVPDIAHMELDMHLVPPDTIGKAKERMDRFIKGLFNNGILNEQTKVKTSIKNRETPYIPPYITNERARPIRKVLNLIGKQVGDPVLNYGTSVADDNIIATSLHVPMCTIGPSGGNIHSKNEWVSSKSMLQLSSLYKRLIEEA